MSGFRSIGLYIVSFGLLLLACEKDEPVEEQEENRIKEEVGAAAEDLLKGSPYAALDFQLLYMEGYEPRKRSIDSLERFLDRYLHKPNGIDIEIRKIDSEGQGEYGVEAIDEIIEKHVAPSSSDDRIDVQGLIVDGSYSQDDRNAATLGIAYRARRMGIFGGSIHEYSDEPTEPSRWKLEATVLRHEFGHLLGLVDNGTPMVNDHRDGSHGAHCENNDCLMYYQAETSDIVGDILGSDLPRLDADCQADLEANGGK